MENRKETDTGGIKDYHKTKWCDLSCEFADFPDKYALDGSGTCRTFAALYCKKLKQIVTKNAPCAVKHGARRPTVGW
jgi:hypothetical protein